MKKEDLKYLWTMAWGTAAMFARWTRTTADDAVVAALQSDAVFEEFWAFLVSKGWATAGRVETRPLSLAAARTASESQSA